MTMTCTGQYAVADALSKRRIRKEVRVLPLLLVRQQTAASLCRHRLAVSIGTTIYYLDAECVVPSFRLENPLRSAYKEAFFAQRRRRGNRPNVVFEPCQTL